MSREPTKSLASRATVGLTGSTLVLMPLAGVKPEPAGVAVNTWVPSASLSAGWYDHLPLPSALTVPAEEPSMETATRALGSAVPDAVGRASLVNRPAAL